MGSEGDTKHIWNPKNEIEVEAARILFEKLKAEGYKAYRLNRLQRRGKELTEFSEARTGRAVFVAPRTKAAAETDGEQSDRFDQNADHVMVPAYAGG